MSRYLDPKNDLVFKKFFGRHPELLVSFLNAVLPLPKGKIIERLEYLPTENVSDLLKVEKRSIVDVRCYDQGFFKTPTKNPQCSYVFYYILKKQFKNNLPYLDLRVIFK